MHAVGVVTMTSVTCHSERVNVIGIFNFLVSLLCHDIDFLIIITDQI